MQPEAAAREITQPGIVNNITHVDCPGTLASCNSSTRADHEAGSCLKQDALILSLLSSSQEIAFQKPKHHHCRIRYEL